MQLMTSYKCQQNKDKHFLHLKSSVNDCLKKMPRLICFTGKTDSTSLYKETLISLHKQNKSTFNSYQTLLADISPAPHLCPPDLYTTPRSPPVFSGSTGKQGTPFKQFFYFQLKI